MTVAELITFVRNQTGISSSNIADAIVIDYLNIAYHKIENAIVDRVDEDYFWDIFTTDTVEDQNEYVMPTHDATTEGIKRILNVAVKWDTTDTYHTLLNPRDIADFDYDDAQLQAQANQANGWWEFRDGSVFLYPAPDGAVTNGLKITAVKSLIDLASGGAESTIFPRHSDLRQYHYIIGLGAIPLLERHRNVKDKNDVMNSMEMYRIELDTMIDELNSKYAEPMQGTLPNLEVYY